MDEREEHQAADNKVHLAYFNTNYLISFVWNGSLKTSKTLREIDVCVGGYAEPVTETFNMSDNLWEMLRYPKPKNTIWGVFKEFKKCCDEYCATRWTPSPNGSSYPERMP